MRILGIDPGSIICGYGVIEKNGNEIKVIEYGVINVKKQYESIHLRLKEIYCRLLKVIERVKPEVTALESMFYSRNAQSLIKLSYARAAAMLAAVMNDIPIAEYSPREVKKSVTGKGNASKEQVQFMVKSILGIKETPEFFDATDALAVAICHAQRYASSKKNAHTWEEYIKSNPQKVVKL